MLQTLTTLFVTLFLNIVDKPRHDYEINIQDQLLFGGGVTNDCTNEVQRRLADKAAAVKKAQRDEVRRRHVNALVEWSLTNAKISDDINCRSTMMVCYQADVTRTLYAHYVEENRIRKEEIALLSSRLEQYEIQWDRREADSIVNSLRCKNWF